MKIRQTQTQGTPMNPLSIYMMSETSPDADTTNWYEFYPETPGTYKVTIWHRGTRALQQTINVTPLNKVVAEPAPGHPLLLAAAATLLTAAAATIITKRLTPSYRK